MPKIYAYFVRAATALLLFCAAATSSAAWVTDSGLNAIMRFDPQTQKFQSFPSNQGGATVHQMLGRPGEAWGAESGNDRLVVVLD